MACCTGSAAAAPAPAAAAVDSGRRRTYEEECKFLRRLDANSFEIQMGFVPNMKVRILTRISHALTNACDTGLSVVTLLLLRTHEIGLCVRRACPSVPPASVPPSRFPAASTSTAFWRR